MRKTIAALTAAFLLTTSFGALAQNDATPTPPPAVTAPAPAACSDALGVVSDALAKAAELKWQADKYEGADYKAFAAGVLAVMTATDPALFDQFDAVYVVSGNPEAPDVVLVLLAKDGCVVNAARISLDTYVTIQAAIKAQAAPAATN